MPTEPAGKNARLHKILQHSTYFHQNWHTLIISLHGDHNTIVEWKNVLIEVRRRRRRIRYIPGPDGKLTEEEPWRWYEAVVTLHRMRKVGAE